MSTFLGDMSQRTALIFSEIELHYITGATVLLAGVGGVGGICGEVLARMGVKRLIIIDADVVQPSNINRQILATTKSIDQDKVTLAVRRYQDIYPDIEIIAIKEFLHKENISSLLEQFQLDMIVDAIDSVGSKAHLIAYAIESNIPVVTALGIAQRRDPGLIGVVNLFETRNDPLARSLRTALKKMGIQQHIPAVFSRELPIKTGDEVSKQDGEKFLGSYASCVFVAGAMLAHTAIELFLNEQKKRKKNHERDNEPSTGYTGGISPK
ncbi:ThiF family adenylyltransferase [Entomospira entomophila]|uniref:tRNA threonylcarbamoyladenosine dehydratase n=1 Tax=Entomospira entomophila TaxID=2719988 RepID=A0A968GEI0_9SPIO|nr:ThiF family adenylyltransferase [Entomospira entomophilus]NIZ40984.1 tRNA threonylcarbamoyladenosine dehydratase [Entomospira entomophilus]WDI35197.1 ThiF family adenylyltransferase [Entomospira entomophilus]